MHLIVVLWASDLLFNCRVVAETVKRGRREEEEKITGWRTDQLPKDFRRNGIHAKLIDKDELGRLRIRQNSGATLECSFKHQRLNIQIHSRQPHLAVVDIGSELLNLGPVGVEKMRANLHTRPTRQPLIVLQLAQQPKRAACLGSLSSSRGLGSRLHRSIQFSNCRS